MQITDIKQALDNNERLQKLLNGGTIEDWFVSRGYIKSKDWGWVKQERIQRLLDMKVLAYDEDLEDYILTSVSMDGFKNKPTINPSLVIKYLNGDINEIREAF